MVGELPFPSCKGCVPGPEHLPAPSWVAETRRCLVLLVLVCKLAFVCKVRLKCVKPLLTPAVPYLGPTKVGIWKQKAGHQMKKKGCFCERLWNKRLSGPWVAISWPKPIFWRLGWRG